MWRLQLAIRPGHASRLDGREVKTAVFCGGDAAVTAKARLECLCLCVVRMRVSAVRICLPKLEDRVSNALSIGVEHAPFDLNPFAGDAGTREVVYEEPLETDEEERTDRL